jgi:hypothetical protein
MDYRDVPFKGLKFSYIIYENGDVYRIINDKKRLVSPRGGYICLTEESGRRVQIKHISLLLHSFYGGYFKRRKFKIRNSQKPLHIKNVKWKEGFGQHIDFEYLDNLNVDKLNFENNCIRQYYYTDDARYIIKVLDKNKGLYYEIFKYWHILPYFNDFYEDLKIKFLERANSGLLIPEENSHRLNVYLKRTVKFYAMTIIDKKVKSNQIFTNGANEFSDNIRASLMYDIEDKDYEDLEDEIGDMFNYFSS